MSNESDTFTKKDDLNFTIDLFNQEKDLIRIWWTFLTSISSALIIGLFLAYLSGKIPDQFIPYLVAIIFSIFPIMLIFVLDLFFRLIEINYKIKKVTYAYYDKTISFISFENLQKLLEFRYNNELVIESPFYLKFFRKNYKRRVVFPLIMAVYFEFAILLEVYLLFSGFFHLFSFFPFTFTLILFLFLIIILIILVFILYDIHRYTKKVIDTWPDNKYWF